MKTGSELYLLIMTSLISTNQADIFTSMAEMEGLVETQDLLLKLLRDYINYEEIRFNTMKRHLLELEQTYQDSKTDIQTYLQHPVNAFLIIKRLTTTWNELQKSLLEETGKYVVGNVSLLRKHMAYPDNEDLTGSALALTRIQETYLLNASTIARGQIQGITSTRELNADDCFRVGLEAYNSKDYNHAIQWLQESLNRLHNEPNSTVSRAIVLDYLAFSLYKEGDPERAISFMNELLEIDPNHPQKVNLEIYKSEIPVAATRNSSGLSKLKDAKTESDWYEALCRGENKLTLSTAARLNCRFTTNKNPYLLIQPIKEEEAFLFPRLVVFHDVVSDKDIEQLIQLAKPQLLRSLVQNRETGTQEPASYRVSKVAWFKEHEGLVVRRVNSRINDITRLDLVSAELLQVANYGIGGHYLPHLDFNSKGDEDKEAGNRIATALLYMNDVTAGGATVFPDLGVALWPKKRSMAFWFNLLRSGDGNTLTRHAACPVLAGTKWVSNKWIHEFGQEFIRPCGRRHHDLS